MDIYDLRCFVQAAKDGVYSAAAEKLDITQPALSKTIQKLEREVGSKLFFPFAGRQRLTDAGEALFQHAIHTIHEYDGIYDIMDRSSYTGKIFFGFPPLMGTCYLSGLIASFSSQYPNIKICIKEEGSQSIMADIDRGDLDIGCVIGPVSDMKFDHALFLRDSFVLVVSDKHPLSKKDHAAVSDLRGEKFITSGSDFGAYQALRYACHRYDFEPQIIIESGRWDFAIQMARLNYGITFQPRSLFEHFSFPNTKILTLDEPAFMLDIEFISKKDLYTSRIVNCFIEYAMDYASRNQHLMKEKPAPVTFLPLNDGISL